MFSFKLKNFNKINLLSLRNALFYETQPKHSLNSIFLRQYSNKKLSLHEKTVQLENDIKKLGQKISVFDNQVAISEADSQPPLSEDFLSQIYKTISGPPEAPRLKKSDILNNPKLSNADKRDLGLFFPSVMDLQVSKQEQIYQLTQTKKENLKTVEQFNNWLYACVLTEQTDEVLDIFLLMEKAGVIPNVITYDHLINLYASVGSLQKAIASFDLIEPAGIKPTVYSYANLIKAYVKYDRIDDAFNVYSNMKNNGLIPTQPIFTTLIKGCINSGEIKRAWTTFDHMRLEVCQPDEVTFSLMIHACAKEGNAERAFDLYQEMKEKGLCPTDVTFNSLIHACAKRKDYYEEAFKLLQEMREYGYQPDKTTCNSLMVACSKKGDLQMARNLIRSMMQSAKTYHSLAPDELTFTNLFWTYSTYKEPMNYISKSQQEKILKDKQLEASSENDKKNDSLELSREDQIDQKDLLKEVDMETPIISEGTHSENAVSENHDYHDLLIMGSNTYPLLNDMPVAFSQTVKEAEMVFNYIITSQSNIKLSPKLITSYLNILVKKSNYNNVFEFYKNFIPKYNIKLNGWIFLSELMVCYKHKRVDESWSIWYDWENWKQEQIKEIEKIYDDEHDRKDAFKEIGITEKMEYEIYKSMIKILSRCNEVPNAIRLLQTLSNLQRPDIQDFTLLLQKCVENDDEISHRNVINLCYNDTENNKVLQYRNLLAKKWKGRGIKLPPKNKYYRSGYDEDENIQRKKSWERNRH